MADAVMSPRPAARPSRPSTKFIALTIDTVSARVSRIDDAWSSTMVPTPPIGMYSTLHATPMVTRTLAAVIWPANFVRASRPQRSSIRPISMIRPPATTTAGIPDEYTKPRVSAGNWDASKTAAATPTYIANPPMRGTGWTWTSRSRG